MSFKTRRFLAALLLVALIGVCTASLTSAQQGGTTNFLYDKNGRLHFVILQTGEGARYDYDPAGNITGIQRFPAGTFLVSINPSTATVNQSGTVQFTSVIPPELGSTDATWSVDGVVGGNAFVGTISQTGLYTAPGFFHFSARVRAASSIAPNIFAEATVFMADPNSNPGLVSPVVTVGRGDQGQRAPIVDAATSSIVSVNPHRLARESATRLIIRGTKLSASTNISFIDKKGTPDSSISVSNISANSDGSSLTAIVKVAAGADLGGRLVIVTNKSSGSQPKPTVANTIEIVAR